MFRKVAVLSLALALLAAMPGTILARSSHATLINIHVTHAKPGPATANCSNDPGTDLGDYELTGWAVGGNKTARLNANTVPSGLSNVAAVLDSSFDAWGNVSGANIPDFSVVTGATVTKATANHSYDLMWGRTSGSSIAVTYTWQWSNGEIESDTVFNSRLPWFIANDEPDHCVAVAKYDLANIATHEFGHTYGLGHAANDRWETMYPYGFTGETAKRSLGSGDIAGVRAVYN